MSTAILIWTQGTAYQFNKPYNNSTILFQVLVYSIHWNGVLFADKSVADGPDSIF